MGKRSEGKPPSSQSNFAHQIFRHYRGVVHKQTAKSRPLKASETERPSSECTTLISSKAKRPRHRIEALDDASKKETGCGLSLQVVVLASVRSSHTLPLGLDQIQLVLSCN